ncbi:ABC transporter ATP-binding protein [Mycobacterium sp. Z3061]|uniref:ABC transporter ATP-binding protein n=1 Tax=Mycobacterium sp. Z3061 TaxID=3073562 RepID=UPI002873D27C|nr:ABC transporter ATP-binding protein [Mycobacterium sp. Z3061]
MLFALLRQYTTPYRGLIAVLVLLELISNLASLYLPAVNASIIDDGVAKGDTRVIAHLGAVMLAATGVQMLCAVGAVYFGSQASMGLGRDVRSALFRHIIGFAEQDAAPFGAPSLLTRTTNDVQQVEEMAQLTFTVLITAPIVGVGGIVMAIHQNAGLAWLLAVSVPLLGMANYLIVARIRPLVTKLQTLVDALTQVLREQLLGIKVIRAFTRESVEQERFANVNRALSQKTIALGRWQLLMVPVATLLINLSSVALIWFGGLRIDAGRMQVGSLVAYLAYFTQILMAVMLTTLLVEALPRASVCGRRIGEVLATVPAITSPLRAERSPHGIEGVVRLDRVTFRYPRTEQVAVQDVSLMALPGTTTAIVGGSGSGKSTLISLICRLFDVTSGAVLIDGTDVREYDTERLCSAIGLVPQRGYLFSGTVADNLRYGSSGASESEMWEALRLAAADGFVRAHPDGLQMSVLQGGSNLSGGQRQMLAIARAVISRPAIYLFDDAFSALDVHTDSRVRDSLRDVAEDSTVIIVAQRICTVASADQIVVLDDGRVVGTGTHQTLLLDCPTYAELANLQSVGAAVAGEQ